MPSVTIVPMSLRTAPFLPPTPVLGEPVFRGTTARNVARNDLPSEPTTGRETESTSREVRGRVVSSRGGEQEVMINDREIVPAMRRALAERVGAERYDLWFAGSTRFRVVDDRLIVAVASSFL